ncbi:MAG: ZIP family metal transporter [Clostridia bacterium]|nr:ZIP family metal transporter [Clostridia bacterium]
MTFIGILIPFIGTTLGAGCVLFFKQKIKPSLEKPLLGFSAGVMVAASVWSLLIPSIEQSKSLGKLSFFPATVGLLLGVGLLPIVDAILPKLKLTKAAKLVLAVTVHNIPEGMAVGIVFAGMLSPDCNVTLADALALSIGIAIQNFPEGAIVSLPVLANGNNKAKSFLIGTMSGAVEPIFAVITLLMFGIISPIMPYLLAFAAGAMLFVVVDELIPEASLGAHNNLSTFSFAIGFCVMMILDVVFG